jgi:hypothetical protein
LALFGCDLGPRAIEPSQGPPLELVASDPANGAGLDCDRTDPTCGVPTDVTLALSFDRFLLPDTAIRQSITFYTGDPSNPVPPPSNTRPELTPVYDLLTRTVRYALPPGLTLEPHALYTVELPIYVKDTQPLGFRAFDGAPLAGTEPVRLSFFTGAGPGAPVPSNEVPTCEAFMNTLAGCGGSICHGREGLGPAMGLDLESASELRATAVGRPAHQTEIGDTTGVADQDPARFGANMPIIDPGRPDNSYLMYKLLIGPEPYEPAPGTDCPPGDRCDVPAVEEFDRLRNWFVRGEPMPWLSNPEERFIHHDEARLIQSFIAHGDACADSP